MFLIDYNISPRKEYSPHILRMAKTAKAKSRINSKVKSERNQSGNVQTAHLKLKRKPGAPKGNRNARKHGLYSGEMLALMAQARRVIAEMKLAAALVRAEAARMDAESSRRLSAALGSRPRTTRAPRPVTSYSVCSRMRLAPLSPRRPHRASPGW